MTAVLVCASFLAPATAACLYYAVLTTIGWRRPGARTVTDPRYSFAVVIPAHNEEQGLGDTIRSIRAADYPADKLRVVVVADNCTDRTAAVARDHGAECIERHDASFRGKGYALAFALPRVLAGGTDVVLVVDADCDVSPDAVRALDAVLADGAAVTQAAVVPRNPYAQPSGLVAMVGSVIENGVSAGLDRLGGAVSLRGTGMAFRREVLEQFPWAAFGLTEDAEYGATLRAAGVRVRFVPGAEVRSEAPPDAAALCTQRRRWRAALFSDGQSLLDRAFRSKPLVLAHLLAAAAVAVGSALTGWLPLGWDLGFGVWAVTLLGATSYVYLRAMRRAGRGVCDAGNLWLAGAVVARLAWVTAAGILRRSKTWERTPRAAEVAAR